MKPLHPIAQTEMLIELIAARAASELFSIEKLLQTVGNWSRRAARHPVREQRADDEWQEIAELLAHRASRLVPGARCLHRALACRVWLARRGIDATIVVGFRKRGALEGHAWLEIVTPGGSRTMFKSDGDDYRESFREAA
ncbi:MAG: lasso peptide biosynthesis B2 protein [Persicimonas sp.]